MLFSFAYLAVSAPVRWTVFFGRVHASDPDAFLDNTVAADRRVSSDDTRTQRDQLS